MSNEKNKEMKKQDLLDAFDGSTADIINIKLNELEQFIYRQVYDHYHHKLEGLPDILLNPNRQLEITMEVGISGLSLWKSIKVRF